jgi:aconitate hydratase
MSYACFTVGGQTYAYADLRTALAKAGLGAPEDFPASILVLAEMLLRESSGEFSAEAREALGTFLREGKARLTVPFRPTRLLLQDYTGIPVLVDLAALREAAEARGLPRANFTCKVQADLIVDHSLVADEAGDNAAEAHNTAIEAARNTERFAFLQWAAGSFPGLRVFAPGAGICHQINMEYLAGVVCTEAGPNDATPFARSDTVLGADSHTTTVNGLGVLGWGVGGIEALVALLGHAVATPLPEVVGVHLTNELPDGTTATDLVLSLTEIFRRYGVVGRFLEFCGPGLASLSATDRATVANMAPEAGATCAFFPVDSETLRYLRLTGRDEGQIALVEVYARRQGLWRDATAARARFSAVIELDLAQIEPCLAGPSRPEERVALREMATVSRRATGEDRASPEDIVAGKIRAGDVVLAAITSCTNTANPDSVIAAGLLARNAVQAGLSAKPWVKTSFAPGSRVVRDYLERAELQPALDALGFNIVGFGCTTCIGNAGPLRPGVSETLSADPISVSAVLSGNRNFANRVHPQVPNNYLASPALVIAYALAGSTHADLTGTALGTDAEGRDVYLRDLWPSRAEIEAARNAAVGADLFHARYGGGAGTLTPTPAAAASPEPWTLAPTYVARPPLHHNDTVPDSLRGARILLMLGDGITTDQISPASAIRPGSRAGKYLAGRGVAPAALHSFGARRGQWEVMLQGAFTNPSLRNALTPEHFGGMTRYLPTGETMAVQEAAERYRVANVPLVIIAGRNYGTGSSRDDAAKSTRYLGVMAVIAESFERIHRSNLLALGVLPLLFPEGQGQCSLGLTGEEVVDLDLSKLTGRGASVPCRIAGRQVPLMLSAAIETVDELGYWQAGGVLAYLLARAASQQ